MSAGRYVVEPYADGWTVTDLADPDQSLPTTRRRIPRGSLSRAEAEQLAVRLEAGPRRRPAQLSLLDEERPA